MDKKRDLFLTLAGVVTAFAILVVIISVMRGKSPLIGGGTPTPGVKKIAIEPFGKLEPFKSDEEFKQYLEQSQTSAGGNVFYSTMRADKLSVNESVGMQAAPMANTGMAVPERVSQTNTQVLGIDEPDILKTDGDNLYYSSPFRLFRKQIMSTQPTSTTMDIAPVKSSIGIVPPDRYPPVTQQGGIAVIKAFPPTKLASLTDIDASGDLLLSKNVLVVFNEQTYNKRSIDGFDVSDPAKPVKKWSIPYKQNSSRVEARLFNDKLYLVNRLAMGGGNPCPVVPFDLKEGNLAIPCTRIYHPSVPAGNDAVYTVARINLADGKIEDSTSFIGSAGETSLYMSRGAIYLTYHYQSDMSRVMSAFVSENGDMFGTSLVAKLDKLQGYDLSPEAKMVELSSLIGRFMNTMDEDKRLTFETNMENRVKKFLAAHARELDKTGIVKVNVGNLSVAATGSVPGQVLNQYSLDEYNGNLRIATTIGQNSWIGGFGSTGGNSFSDVYVLDGGLSQRGAVTDLGKKERIYSVRFMADRGYVVTFRQTDPFYVLDLSNPGRPELKGELKIPGYSSYLHPLGTDIILGLGQDEGNVKLSLFSVKDPTAPQEIDNFQMNEYWSEALNNPHAFLNDAKHQVFFMPGSKGGYVFSYEGNKLKVAKAVADVQVQRAAYINNYLYIIGQDNIVVLDEGNWSKVSELAI